MWINKFIAHTGYCSRREADKLVEEGKVTVNGQPAVKTQHVWETDEVKVDGKALTAPKRHRIYIALNKPLGTICTTETQVENNVIDLVGHEERIFPIGRMDRDCTGLLFLTNDGDIVNRYISNELRLEKEYYVRVDKRITVDFINKMFDGMEMDGTHVKPVRIKRVAPKAFKITILEDYRRQIRRMCSYLGFRVFKIDRIRIMHIHLQDIQPGDWRYLTRDEVMKLFKYMRYHPAMKWNKPGEVTAYPSVSISSPDQAQLERPITPQVIIPPITAPKLNADKPLDLDLPDLPNWE